MQYFCIKSVQYNGYLVSTVDIDGLLLQHQGISSNRFEYALTCFQLFRGWLMLTSISMADDSKTNIHFAQVSMIMTLTHWGQVTHICVNDLTIIGSDNGLSPGRHQAIIWTNTGILLIVLLGTNFSEILIEICTLSFKKIHFKMLPGKWQPFCLCLNDLRLVSQ